MRIIGCDLRARQQVLAMPDSTTEARAEVALRHEGGTMQEFLFLASTPAARENRSDGFDARDFKSQVELEANAWSAIRHGFAESSHEPHNLILKLSEWIRRVCVSSLYKTFRRHGLHLPVPKQQRKRYLIGSFSFVLRPSDETVFDGHACRCTVQKLIQGFSRNHG